MNRNILILTLTIFFVILGMLLFYLAYCLKRVLERLFALQKKELDILQGNSKKIKEAEQRLTSIEEKILQKEKQFNLKYNFEELAIQSRLKDYESIKRQSIDQQLEFKRMECQKQKDLYNYLLSLLRQEVLAAAASLLTLKLTRKAAYLSLLRLKEIKSKADDYRLVPSNIELSDIKKLEKVKMELAKPRILSMLIWQTYWQPLAKVKFPVILKDKTKMGIYKITNIQTGESYIGQAVKSRPMKNFSLRPQRVII